MKCISHLTFSPRIPRHFAVSLRIQFSHHLLDCKAFDISLSSQQMDTCTSVPMFQLAQFFHRLYRYVTLQPCAICKLWLSNFITTSFLPTVNFKNFSCRCCTFLFCLFYSNIIYFSKFPFY